MNLLEPTSTWSDALDSLGLRGVGDYPVDGACRDVEEIRETGLWLASRYVTPLSGKGRINVTSGNIAVTVCGIPVNPGDCIVGDETGLVCISSDCLTELLEIAEALTTRDQQFAEALREGESFHSAAACLRHL
jgi:3-hexulose-6-phosphate synthase / 6-phospho-3-hexuloisomerase